MTANLPPVNPKSRAHRAQLVDEMRDDLLEIAEQEFRNGIPHSADDFANRMLASLRRKWGGAERYIPADDSTRRDRAIRKLFNGRNLIEVCSEYAVSPSTVYRVCNSRS